MEDNHWSEDSVDIVGVPSKEDGGWMQIANGHIFHPLDPRTDEVFIADIAQSLSRQIRYNGNSDKSVSVAQHSCQCAWLVEQTGGSAEVQLAMLMHDAAEAYIGDMIRPLKAHFPEFTLIEDRIMAVIQARYDLPLITPKAQKYYDNLALAWEKRDMYKSSREWPHMLDVPSWVPEMYSWSMSYSNTRFLQMFEYLRLEIASSTK